MATNFTEVELVDQLEQSATQARKVTITFDVSESALRRVRAGFNPDKLTAVGNLHLITAGIITAMERLRDRDKPVVPGPYDPPDIPASKLHEAIEDARRHAALAITNFETGCMYAVKAATSVLYHSRN